MSLHEKTKELRRFMVQKAEDLGLIFTSGPDPAPVSAPEFNINRCGYQERGIILIGVAEKVNVGA